MDLLNPSIRKEFVTHIFSILPPSQRNIPREFLDEFVIKLAKARTGEEEFPISILEMVSWIGIDYKNIKRLLDPNYSKKSKDYTEGVDWISREVKSENKTSRRKSDIFLSLNCFEQLCLRLNGEKSKMLRNYFIIIEHAYSEWFSDASHERRKCESEEDTKYKEDHVENYYDDYPKGSVAYADGFEQNDVKYLKFGSTETLGIRMPQLAVSYPGKHHLDAYQKSDHPRAIEECSHKLAASFRIPCEGHPCPREVYFRENLDPEDILQSCKEGIDFAEQKFKERSAAKGKSTTMENPKKTSTLILRDVKAGRGMYRDLSKEVGKQTVPKPKKGEY